MLSKNKIKSFRSLEMKKNRDANDVFVAEGPKVVHDILSVSYTHLTLPTILRV